MAISPIGGQKGGLTVSNTSLTLTYSPTAGNEIFLGLNIDPTATSITVKDQNGNALTAGATISIDGTHTLMMFYGVAVSGATSYKAAWTNSVVAGAALEEYSIGSGSVIVATHTNSGTSTTATIAFSIAAANNWVVAFLAAGVQTLTTSVGNQRQQLTTTAARITAQDNTAASITTVTNSATLSSHAWGAVALEISVGAASTNNNLLMMMGCGT